MEMGLSDFLVPGILYFWGHFIGSMSFLLCLLGCSLSRFSLSKSSCRTLRSRSTWMEWPWEGSLTMFPGKLPDNKCQPPGVWVIHLDIHLSPAFRLLPSQLKLHERFPSKNQPTEQTTHRTMDRLVLQGIWVVCYKAKDRRKSTPNQHTIYNLTSWNSEHIYQ